MEEGGGRLAVLGFLPDLGHLVPLLRVAREAERRGFDVRCLVPHEGLAFAERHGLRAEAIGPVTPDGSEEALRDLVRHRDSLLYPLAADRLWRQRTAPIMLRLAEAFPELVERTGDLQPDLILSSAHQLKPIYRGIARSLSVPLVTHLGVGSLRLCQDEAVRRWGPSPPRFHRVRLSVERRIRRALPRLRRTFAHRRWREDRHRAGRLADLLRTIGERGAPVPEHHIGTGLAALERRYLPTLLRPCDGTTFFGSLDPMTGLQPSDELARWLAGSDVPVVLVSFGTLLRPAPRVLESVVRGLERVDVRILMVSSDPVDGVQAERPGPERLRRERSIPQPEVLAHPAVRAFVTHAGYGGVQESIWTGTPMLCVPLLWDQPFNAQSVAAFGSGVDVGSRPSAGSIRRAATALLENPGYARRARELADEIRAEEGARRVSELLRSAARAGSRVS